MSTVLNLRVWSDRKNVFWPYHCRLIELALIAGVQMTMTTTLYYRSIQNGVQYSRYWPPMCRSMNWNGQPNDSTHQIDDNQPSNVVVIDSIVLVLLVGQIKCPRKGLSCWSIHQSTVDFVIFGVSVDRVFVVVMMTMTKDQMMKLN